MKLRSRSFDHFFMFANQYSWWVSETFGVSRIKFCTYVPDRYKYEDLEIGFEYSLWYNGRLTIRVGIEERGSIYVPTGFAVREFGIPIQTWKVRDHENVFEAALNEWKARTKLVFADCFPPYISGID